MRYIGARYVPIWYKNSLDDSSNWEVNVEYEALTFVTSANNHLYLSKKTVPDNIGTPAQNTDYWLDMGLFSGSYPDLVQRIGDLETEVGTLSDLQTEVTTDIVSAINSLVARDNFYILQGDSYAIPDSYGGNCWAQNVAANLGLSSDDYLLLDNNSGGFTDPGQYGTFQQQLEANVVTDKRVTHVLVAAGANDRDETYATLCNDIASYIAKAKELYPYAKIYIACIAWCETGTYAQEIFNTSYKAFKETAIANGAIWLESPTNCLLFGEDFYNYLHPSVSGAVLLGRALANELNGHAEDITREKTISVTYNSDYTQHSNNLNVIVRQRGDMISGEMVDGDGLGYFRHTAKNYVSTSWYEIGTLSDGVYNGVRCDFVGEVSMNDGTNTLTSIAMFRIYGDKLYFKPYHPANNIVSVAFFAYPFNAPARTSTAM